MRIYRLSFPLPLETIPVEYGENVIDRKLADEMIAELDSQYHFVKHLGGGMWGIAFLTGDGKVVKITHDLNEFEVAKDLVGHGVLAIVDFYEAREIGEGLYLIVKDKVKPLTEYESSRFYDFYDRMDCDLDNIPEEWEDDMKLFEQFDEYVNTVQNYAFDSDVMRPDNMGWDQYGNLVCFDPRASSF